MAFTHSGPAGRSRGVWTLLLTLALVVVLGASASGASAATCADITDPDLAALCDSAHAAAATAHDDAVAIEAAVADGPTGGTDGTVSFSPDAQEQLDGNTTAIRADLWYALGVGFAMFLGAFLWKMIRPGQA